MVDELCVHWSSIHIAPAQMRKQLFRIFLSLSFAARLAAFCPRSVFLALLFSVLARRFRHFVGAKVRCGVTLCAARAMMIRIEQCKSHLLGGILPRLIGNNEVAGEARTHSHTHAQRQTHFSSLSHLSAIIHSVCGRK